MRPVLLAELQADFQAYVLGKERAHGPAVALVEDGYGLAAEDRLAIYYDAYRIRLADALSEAYDKTHAYVGDEMFAELAAAYIERHPSSYRNMRWYGEAFPGCVEQVLSDHPVVAELAAFEWALGLAFDAADASVLTVGQLERLDADDWECAGFDFQPGMRLLELRWNAPALWLALQKDEQPPEPIRSETACTWLVWRKNLQPHFRSLDAQEARAVRELAQGKSFSQVCAEIAETDSSGDGRNESDEGAEGPTLRIAGWLRGWIDEGALSGICIPARSV